MSKPPVGLEWLQNHKNASNSSYIKALEKQIITNSEKLEKIETSVAILRNTTANLVREISQLKSAINDVKTGIKLLPNKIITELASKPNIELVDDYDIINPTKE